MLADRLRPPEGLRRQQTDPPPPAWRRHGRAGLVSQPDLALVGIQIRDRPQQQALAGTGWTGQEDQFTGRQRQVHRGQEPMTDGVESQSSHQRR